MQTEDTEQTNIPDVIIEQDQSDIIKTKSEELHVLATQTQIDMINGIKADPEYINDPKKLRLLNEIIGNANTNSLHIKKLGIEEKTDSTNKMLVALALSMAKRETGTIETISSLVSTRSDGFVAPTINSDKVFDSGSLEQGLRPITFEEVFKK